MTQQIDDQGRLRHLLTLEGLPRQLLEGLLDRAQAIIDDGGERVRGALAGQALCTLFFEPSTRTRLSFQRAAQRLGADVLNFDASTSSTTKGESAADTLRTIEAMGVHAFVVRDRAEGAAAGLAAVAGPGTAIINAGDGRSAHPTQGLLDMLSLRQARGRDFSGLKVLVVGDVRHSRVARSDLHALRILGAGEVRICGPEALLPAPAEMEGTPFGHDLDEAIEGVDAVMMLRLQRERMAEGLVESLEDYHRAYGLTAARLRRAAPGAVVLHPGPMNRGVEIDDDVADGPQSLVLRQVANGVPTRMAVLEALLARGPRLPVNPAWVAVARAAVGHFSAAGSASPAPGS